MLVVKDLHAQVEDKEILRGLSLEVGPGEVHAIMGPNGSGKSTLGHILAGHPAYEVTGGSVQFDGKDLLDLETDERAHAGIFLAFQYPVEIPGVNMSAFLKTSINAIRKQRGEEELDALAMRKLIKSKGKELGNNEDMMKRAVNVGFAGGEKKRNEILQMALLEPTLAILDETDSGLDIDALKTVAEGVNKLATPNSANLVITHYQRLLNYIVPDYVHVMCSGQIIKTGSRELALALEAKGYEWLLEEQAVTP